MARTTAFSLLAISSLLIGLNAGFFYTWSFTIMQSLGQIDTAHAISAMQTINANIRSAWFAAIFFGAPLALLITSAMIFRSNRSAAKYALLAFVFATATIIITLRLHVPMNNELATVDSATAANSVWSVYSERWTSWNHIRMLTSILAFGFSLTGLANLRTKHET